MLFALLLASQVIELSAGVITVSEPYRVPPGVTLRGHLRGTTLRAATGFNGRALVECGSGSAVEDLTIDGVRNDRQELLPIAPWNRDFIGFYNRNGLAAEGVESLNVRRVRFVNISGFAAVVARSRNVTFDTVSVQDSGSLNPKGRNNTTGGILLEEGTTNFLVTRSSFVRVRGNAVWTHSRAESPRNGPGRIEENRFEQIGRDAIQVGHATAVVVSGNSGRGIGFPEEIVDVEGGGVPVAIDTAGDVEQSEYKENHFSDINGKCIDLDGFHHGAVRRNICTDLTNFAVVFNNTNPGMQSSAVVLENNVFERMKYGGIFVVGHGHTIRGNKLLQVNLAGCNQAPNCIYDAAQPDMLRSGIYLGHKAERPAPAYENTITNNVIEGHGMSRHCIVASPQTARRRQLIQGNECRESTRK